MIFRQKMGYKILNDRRSIEVRYERVLYETGRCIVLQKNDKSKMTKGIRF
jgi:hypothetical protein